MTNKEREDELEKIYSEFFANCSKTNCCNQETLSKKYVNNFLYDHGVEFSPNYFDKEQKVLVVGLEKCRYKQDRAVCKELESGDNPHWKGTTLEIILFNDAKLTNEEMEEIERNKELRNEKCKKSDFSFTDFYKCAFSKDDKFSGNMLHTQDMKNFCKELFKKEIDFLIPDLVIMQGINNKEILDYAFDSKGTEIPFEDGLVKQGLWKYSYNGRNIYALVTPFPTHRTTKEYQWNEVKNDIYDMIRICRDKIG